MQHELKFNSCVFHLSRGIQFNRIIVLLWPHVNTNLITGSTFFLFTLYWIAYVCSSQMASDYIKWNTMQRTFHIVGSYVNCSVQYLGIWSALFCFCYANSLVYSNGSEYFEVFFCPFPKRHLSWSVEKNFFVYLKLKNIFFVCTLYRFIYNFARSLSHILSRLNKRTHRETDMRVFVQLLCLYNMIAFNISLYPFYGFALWVPEPK